MKVFVCTDHDCYWPVGVASIVIAENEGQAREILDNALISRNGPKGGLRPHSESPYSLVEIDTTTPHAEILLDGNY